MQCGAALLWIFWRKKKICSREFAQWGWTLCLVTAVVVTNRVSHARWLFLRFSLLDCWPMVGPLTYGWTVDLWLDCWPMVGLLTYGWTVDLWLDCWPMVGLLTYGWTVDLWLDRWPMVGPLTYGWTVDLWLDHWPMVGLLTYGWTVVIRIMWMLIVLFCCSVRFVFWLEKNHLSLCNEHFFQLAVAVGGEFVTSLKQLLVSLTVSYHHLKQNETQSFIPLSETERDPEFHTTIWNGMRPRVSYHHLKKNKTQSFIPQSKTEWDTEFHTTNWNRMRPRDSYHSLKQNETHSFVSQSETEWDPEFHPTIWNRMSPRVSYHNLKWHEAQSAWAESTHKGLISTWKTSHKHNKDLSHLQ